ncbi:MAG: 23S rRNA (pseudouridine(1915)-N(3))-methyltransferase RlmH [Humidesulfovibrio sp.]|jgi:23S rRNA (pseudouridine1915-N3)-methyltransferase|nr:23S rRNA (pseudouridine(1915)-N(3))-methyltransferase RlmH [Humidesulfovibrio sp.]PKN08058.1 MAG: 50S rRNA methyltransferase [Deltaproteobacteria bacterium HGW-Deltaproteobacteria-8]
MAAQLFCLFVGKAREASLRDAADLYALKLSRLARCEVALIKDAPAACSAPEKCLREGRDILARLDPRHLPIALDERGDNWSSRELATKLKAWEDAARTPCFIVGGAFGLSDEVRERARANGALFSLGRITLPHELARVVLLEQLYRAASINKGLPYHHD